MSNDVAQSDVLQPTDGNTDQVSLSIKYSLINQNNKTTICK